MDQLKQQITDLAKVNLIDEIRFIDCGELSPASAFKGRQPLDILPDGKSIIVTSIYIGNFSLPDFNPKSHARTSRLTLSGFYFNIVNPLMPIKNLLLSKGYKAHICDSLLDDNSFPLKAAGVKAGLGWNGRNTLLLNDKYGSFQALGGIITDADLSQVYEEMENKCGICRKCMEACPTHALETPMVLNRTNCISNFLEEEVLPALDNMNIDSYFFECDICQEACPWNKSHLETPLITPMGSTFTSKEEISDLFSFNRLMAMDEKEYKEKVLPLLTGFDLSYALFERNVRLAFASSYLRVEYAYNILPEMRELLLDYQKAISSHLCFEDFKEELENLAEYYPLPKGCLFAGFAEDTLAGCVALKPVDSETCELKRFYVKPEFRGLGLGVMLLGKAITYAKNLGYSEIVLSTLPVMENAVSLYESCGFVEIENACLAHDCESKSYHLNLKV